MNQDKLTILFITHYPGMYGANQSMCRLMVELRAEYNVQPIVLMPSRGDICEFLDQNNIKYFVSHYYWWVNAEKGVFQYLLNWRKQLINLMRVNQLVQLVEAEKIDLVYSNSITINIGAFVSSKLKCPHIWHIRESLESYKFKLSLGKFLSKIFLKSAADKYIVISDYLSASYKHLLPLLRMQRIYNGIDFSRVNFQINKDTATFNLCMMGVISEQKNNLDALKAINLLVTKYKITNIHLHFMGGNNADYKTLLNTYIEENKLGEYIVFHGHVKDIDALLSTMHLGLMCSHNEAFGRVTVEYMMHGMPVIASNSGANSEIVKENINGTVYTIYNADELAEKIYTFVSQPELLKQLGQSAYQYAKNNFSSNRNTALIYEVIEEII